MKIAVIPTEIPYPPNHGGRIDTWNRLIALSRLGVSIHLVTWADEPVTRDQIRRMRSYADSVTIHGRDRSAYLALHPAYPSGIISRRLRGKEYEKELERLDCISPDVILLDGLEGAILATSLAQDLHRPLVYRSHNVEYQYWWQLFLAEQQVVRKILFLVNVPRTKLVERNVRKRSHTIYDISYEDQAYWPPEHTATKSKILHYCLHPDKEHIIRDDQHDRDIDVLYVGNLYTPNNVFGLKWFARTVVPLLGNVRIVVAGATPTQELSRVLGRANAKVLANPRDIADLYSRAHVLINPVWHSSGVNVKMIELVATGKVIVSTSAGTRGLAKRLLEHINIADDPRAFANAILQRLGTSLSSAQQSDVIEEHGWRTISGLVVDLKTIADGPGSL